MSVALPPIKKLDQGVVYTQGKTSYVTLYSKSQELQWFVLDRRVLDFLKEKKLKLVKYEVYIQNKISGKDIYMTRKSEEESYDDDDDDDEYDDDEDEYDDDDDYCDDEDGDDYCDDEDEDDYCDDEDDYCDDDDEDDDFLTSDDYSYKTPTSQSTLKLRQNTRPPREYLQANQPIPPNDFRVISNNQNSMHRSPKIVSNDHISEPSNNNNIIFRGTSEESRLKLFLDSNNQWECMDDFKKDLKNYCKNEKKEKRARKKKKRSIY